jgi:SAM-dependent methyltransferase
MTDTIGPAAQRKFRPSASRIGRCVICGSRAREPVIEVERVPIHPFCPPARLGLRPGFGTLKIVACSHCGHIYNAAFDPSRVDDLYAAAVLTNTPVSESMLKSLEATADFVLARAAPNPVVADVGGGSGALAVALARRAREVHLVEPSRALSAEQFAGTGVTLHASMFPAPGLAGAKFDVIVSRQVIEHIPDPAPFLEALRSQIDERGIVYLELPRAEYIWEATSIVDFHYPHVHYYRRGAVEVLLRRAGFEILETLDIKDGHDMGFLLAPVAPKSGTTPIPHADGSLASRLAVRRASGRRRLEGIGGRIALYGANAYSQALLGLYPDAAAFPIMFDDTPMYEGQRAYGPGGDIPISPPRRELLEGISAVVITAYLHDAVIASKLERIGWQGAVYTVRADSLAGMDARPPSLFRT